MNSVEETKKRDISIDITRGLAILCMIFSNSAGEVLQLPHPIALRAFGSLAAPLFITLAGVMVSLSIKLKDYSFIYFLKRGFYIILVGAFIDSCIWGYFPFISVDVLYTTGLSLPFCYLFFRLSKFYKFIVLILFFVGSIFLQTTFGYMQNLSILTITEITHLTMADYFSFSSLELNLQRLKETDYSIVYNTYWNSLILKRWLIDGWFPAFPWMGFAFLGTIYGSLRFNLKELWGKSFWISLILAFIFISIGVGTWNLEFRMEQRVGYSELFYPPTLSFLVLYIGLSLFLFTLIDITPKKEFYKPLQLLGETSLLIYIFHFLVIGGLKDLFSIKSNTLQLLEYMFLCLAVVFFCLFLSWLVYLCKRKYPNMPSFFKFFLGS